MGMRRLLGSGRTALILVFWGAVLVWGVILTGQYGLVKDLSGRDLPAVRALVAELAPDTRVTMVGPSPLLPLLAPLARESDRLVLKQVAPNMMSLSAEGLPAGIRMGDVQVRSGESWVVLQQPDLDDLTGALTLVASPQLGPRPGQKAPLRDDRDAYQVPLEAGHSLPRDQRDTGFIWMMAGVLLPLGLWAAGGWWRVVRQGR